jgi:cytochrome P450
MWSTLFTIGILLYIIYRFFKYWILDPWRIHKDLWAQGVPGQYTPIVGEVLTVRRNILAGDPLSHFLKMEKKYGSYYHASFGPIPRLLISDPSLIQGVLKTNARCYHKSNLMRLILGTLLGYDNLLMAEDNIHAQHRRLIGPVFKHQNINSMISLMVEITSNLLDKWTLAFKDSKTKGIDLTLDIQNEMTHLTLDIVTGCVFGSGLMKNENVRDIIYRNVTTTLIDVEKRTFNMIGIIPIINRLPLPSKQRIDKSKRDVRFVIQRIIDDRKKGLTKSSCKGFFSNLFINHRIFFLFI